MLFNNTSHNSYVHTTNTHATRSQCAAWISISAYVCMTPRYCVAGRPSSVLYMKLAKLGSSSAFWSSLVRLLLLSICAHEQHTRSSARVSRQRAPAGITHTAHERTGRHRDPRLRFEREQHQAASIHHQAPMAQRRTFVSCARITGSSSAWSTLGVARSAASCVAVSSWAGSTSLSLSADLRAESDGGGCAAVAGDGWRCCALLAASGAAVVVDAAAGAHGVSLCVL